jgi:hypothetical protein
VRECDPDTRTRTSYRRTRSHLAQAVENIYPRAVPGLQKPGAMTSDSLPQTYRVRIPEELQPALDALEEAARTALLAALFERAMQPPQLGDSHEALELDGLDADLELDPERGRLTLVALRARPGAAPLAAVPAPGAPALASPEATQAAWERAGWL